MRPVNSCHTCAKRDRCPPYGTREMSAAFAWAFGAPPLPECDDHEFDAYHGIEGVPNAF